MQPIVPSDWIDFSPRLRHRLEGDVLLAYMRRRRWFREKSRRTGTPSITRIHSFGDDLHRVHLLVVTVGIEATDTTRYFLPLACACGEEAQSIEREFPRRIVADTECDTRRCVIYDGVYSDRFRRYLLSTLLSGQTVHGEIGVLSAHRSASPGGPSPPCDYPSHVSHAEQSNTSIIYGERFFFKLFRKIEPGINPDIELTCYLSETAGYAHVPQYLASLAWEASDAVSALGLLSSFVPDARDVWTWVRDRVDQAFDAVLAGEPRDPAPFLDRVALIGRRTGELHLALAGLPPGEGVAVEDTGGAHRAALERLVTVTMRRVADRLAQEESPHRRESLREALALEEPVLRRVAQLTRHPTTGQLIRIHGDYHLGQLLWRADDLVIIDLEGEPARSLAERRRPDSVFRDVAGMLRSFHYALSDRYLRRCAEQPEQAFQLEPLLSDWYRRTSSAFLEAYRRTVAGSGLVPEDGGDALLEVYILEKAVYELGYELDNRPDWISIPIAGIRFVLEQ